MAQNKWVLDPTSKTRSGAIFQNKMEQLSAISIFKRKSIMMLFETVVRGD